MIAHANHCTYTEAYALADLKRAGADERAIRVLTGDPVGWPESEREPLEFARLLTVAAPTIPDELFDRLRARFGDKKTAAMVLLGAYRNFQDRIVLGLNLTVEPGGPLLPLAVRFNPDAFQTTPTLPTQAQTSPWVPSGKMVIDRDPELSELTCEDLQSRLEQQRARAPRLPVPAWDEVKKALPESIARRPMRIVWNPACYGYVPELALPRSIGTRTMWAEAKPDWVFEESLFWVQTRAIRCNDCMGHCEMLLEVEGLDKGAIADRTRRVSGDGWSSFPPAEQLQCLCTETLPDALGVDPIRLQEPGV